jgi:hypothetical protein
LNFWKQFLTVQANCDVYLDTCFSNSGAGSADLPAFWNNAGRPVVSMAHMDFLHNLLAQGVIEFQVQWAYTTDDLIDPGTGLPVPGLFAGVRWWPSADPAGDTTASSDFDTMGGSYGGAYFNMPGGVTIAAWFTIRNCKTDTDLTPNNGNEFYFTNTFYPKALKFTLTLKDSNGIFADGKTFTHIVYLDN